MVSIELPLATSVPAMVAVGLEGVCKRRRKMKERKGERDRTGRGR
ncbi:MULTISPECIES: hypothetical protein [Candidatus Ichthyocystis]|nr:MULTISPECIES: hypothetical protein [Ichthyocystis]